MNHEGMHEAIERKVDNIFIELAEEYELTSGDVEPLQEVIIGQFKEVLLEYMLKNKNTCNLELNWDQTIKVMTHLNECEIDYEFNSYADGSDGGEIILKESPEKWTIFNQDCFNLNKFNDFCRKLVLFECAVSINYVNLEI